MKRNWIFGTLGIVVLMAVLLAFAKGGDHHHNNVEEQPVEQNDTPTATVEGEILDNHNDFACNLFRALFKREQGNSSIVVSPIGVGYLLGMLNDGADGKTRQQITDVLGLDGSVEEINEYFKMMMDATSGDDSRVTVRIANSIDINSQYSLIARYRTEMQRYYNAQCEALDFSDLAAWIRSITGARAIPKA